MADRIISIDILRGIAVLQMIFWQTFDFFSKNGIYELTSPYFINCLNAPINGIGLALFAFVSGASAYISVIKKLDNNVRKSGIALHAIKRYGGYILLSLFFTSFVFGFNMFYRWGETIQGIGFAALIGTLLILVIKSKWIYAGIGLGIAFVQPFLRKVLENSFIAQKYPLEPVSSGIATNIVSMLLNSSVRGFFSLTHVFPMFLFGAVLSIFIIKSHKQQLIKTTFIMGFLLLFVSVVMHFSFDKIDFYHWSASYLLGFIGLSFLLFSLVEYLLLKFERGRTVGFFVLFGKTSIVAYLLHFLVIYKPLKVFGAEHSLNDPVSFLFTAISVVGIYYICKVWLFKKDKIFDKVKRIFL